MNKIDNIEQQNDNPNIINTEERTMIRDYFRLRHATANGNDG